MTVEFEQMKDQIITGDCLEIMRKIPDESIDVAFIDPPFNLLKDYSSYADNRSKEDYLTWSLRWIFELIRVTKETGSVFIHNIPKWLMEYYRLIFNEKEILSATLKQLEGERNKSDEVDEEFERVKLKYSYFKTLKVMDWIVWNEPGQPKGRYLYANHYGILHLAKSPKIKYYNIRTPHKFCRTCGNLIKDYGGKKDQINTFGTILSDVWDDIHRYKHAKRRDEHPNQLPVPLLDRLLLMSADQGDIVLDPMVGAGTTAVSAKRLGMHYIGIDLDESYCQIARNNLSKTNPSRIDGVYFSEFIDTVLSIRHRDYDKILKHTELITIPVNGNHSKIVSTGHLERKRKKPTFIL